MNSRFTILTRFVCAVLCGQSAYQIQSVAIAWHIFQLAHRPLDIGLAGLSLFLPALIFALPAGELTDRADRRTILWIANALEALNVAAVLFAIVHDVRQPIVYFALLFSLGTIRAFSDPSQRSTLALITGPERFAVAQAQYSAIRQVVVIGGPAIGGLCTAVSTPFAFATSAALFLSAAVLFRFLPPIIAERAKHPLTFGALFDGFHFIRSQEIITAAISLDLFAVLFGGATALLPAFSDGIFHMGPVGLGILRSAPAVGALCVAAYIARRPITRHVGRTLLCAVAVFGAATILFGLSKNFAVSVFALAVAGGGDMVSVVIRNVLVQLGTPESMRGRVSAFENIFIGASNELGEFESGVVASFIGVVPAVVLGGAGTLVIIALWSRLFPRLRTIDQFPQAKISLD